MSDAPPQSPHPSQPPATPLQPRSSSASAEITPSYSDTQSMSSGAPRKPVRVPSTRPPPADAPALLRARRPSSAGSAAPPGASRAEPLLTADDQREFNGFLRHGRVPARCKNDPVIETDGENDFVLLPDGRYRAMWDLLILFLVMYVAFVSIFVISFLHEINTSNAFFWIERVLDVVFFVDIIVNFFTAYLDEVYVTSLPLIARRYLRTWFFVDLIATVPWGIIALGPEDPTEKALLSLPRLLRLLRLFKLFRIMRILRLKEVFTWMEVKLRLKYGHAQLAGLAFLITLVGHWVACLFYFFGVLNENATEPASWIKEAPDSLYGQYIYSLYFSVYTITTIGYGDVVPRTVLERTYVTVIMVLGAICFAYSISKLSEVVNALGAADKQEHDMMDRLTSFASRRKLPQALEYEIRRFLTYHYSIQHVADEKEVLEVLSDQLTLKVLRHMFGPPLVQCRLFKHVCGDAAAAGTGEDSGGVGDGRERLDPLYAQVQEMSHLDRDHVIFREGEPVDGLYVVQRGKVVLQYSDGRVEKMRKGDSFGDANLVVQGRRRATATCAGYTQLLFAPRDAVLAVLRQFPAALDDARRRDADTLWDDALDLLERRAHLDDVATGLHEKATAQRRAAPAAGARQTDSGSGSASRDDDAAATGRTSGSERASSVEELQRVVERKDDRIRRLESRLLEVEQELNRIVGVLRQ